MHVKIENETEKKKQDILFSILHVNEIMIFHHKNSFKMYATVKTVTIMTIEKKFLFGFRFN